MGRPLAVDLCAGLCGWGEGLISEGWRVRAYDIEDMFAAFGEPKPEHVELVVRNVLEMHGSEIADADLIVASPPCTEYSYMAMPWKRAKQIARALRGEDVFPEPYRGSRTVEQLNAIFDACFRLQREASEAAGRHIPMVVENVKGAQPWVGRAAWNYGSFYLWGDLPALMPSTIGAQKFNPDGSDHGPGSWFAVADSKNRGAKNTGGSWFNIGSPGQKVTGRNPVHALASEGVKVPSQEGRRTDPGNGARFTSRDCGVEGRKRPGISFREEGFNCTLARELAPTLKRGAVKLSAEDRRQHLSSARKAASAKIAKIPLALSTHIARVYKPLARAA